MRSLAFLAVLVLVGCVPAQVKEKAVLGEARAARVVQLIDQGAVSFEEIKAWARADLEAWAAMRKAVE